LELISQGFVKVALVSEVLHPAEQVAPPVAIPGFVER
jgi:hypothetical protein